MTTGRVPSLRTTTYRGILIHLRRARRAIDRKEYGHAMLCWGEAQRELGWAIRAFDQDQAHANEAACEMLRRIVIRMGERISRALRPAPASLAYDVVKVVADSIAVLRTRDGLDLEDDAVWERARNTATALLGSFDIRERTEVVSEAPGELRTGSGVTDRGRCSV